MKFNTPRKTLVDTFKRFLSNGKLTRLSSGKYNIKQAITIAADPFVQSFGYGGGGSIFASFTLPATVEAEGEVKIADAKELYDKISGLKGAVAEMDCTDSTRVVVRDEKVTLGYGMEDVKIKRALELWSTTMKYDEGIVNFENQKTGENYQFTKWFTILAGEELKGVSKHVLTDTDTDTVIFNVTDKTLKVSADNGNTRGSYEEEFTVEVHHTANLAVSSIFPVLNSIKGKTEFYYHLTGSGKLRVWVHCGANEWMVRHETAQP